MSLLDRPSPYEPVGVELAYPYPRATIDPDTEKGWIKRLAPIVLAHKGMLGLALAGATVMTFLQLRTPLVARDAVDAVVGSGDEDRLRTLVVVLGVIAVARLFFGFFFRYGLAKVGLEMEYDLRALLYEHMVRLPFSFYDRVQSGQLISRANSDIRTVQMFLQFGPMMAVTGITFLAALGIMLSIHVWLTLLTLVTIPAVYFFGLKMRNVMFPSSWLISARTADMATIVEENVTGIRVVKSFAAEQQQIKLLNRAAQKVLWANNLAVDQRARFSPALQNLPRLGEALVLLYGGALAIDGTVTIGDLLAFMAYLLMLQTPFQMLGFLLMMGQRAAASAQRVFEILDERSDIVDSPGAVDVLDCTGDVELRNVTFRYGTGGDILSDFSLHLRPGETVALVGRTGCGKSTVARLIPRFYDTSAGQVLVDGTDVRDLTVASLRSNIGLVLDEPFLFSESIRDNVAYGRPDATLDEVIAACTAAGAHDFVMALAEGYDTVIGERGYTLSGGQRQRLAIARTLLVNPRILILDDATSAVDVHREQEIHGALKALMAGRTTLIIAHRLSTISLADRVVFMQDGKVRADGTHQRLLRTVPEYAQILAHGEEEWQAAHAKADPDAMLESLPPRLRVMARLAQSAAEKAASSPLSMPGGV